MKCPKCGHELSGEFESVCRVLSEMRYITPVDEPDEYWRKYLLVLCKKIVDMDWAKLSGSTEDVARIEEILEERDTLLSENPVTGSTFGPSEYDAEWPVEEVIEHFPVKVVLPPYTKFPMEYLKSHRGEGCGISQDFILEEPLKYGPLPKDEYLEEYMNPPKGEDVR